MAYRRKRAPNKGKKCTRYKRVRVKGQGMQRRCAKFGGSRGKASKRRRSSYRRKRPFNKGKRCSYWGERHDVRTGLSRRYCRSYGSKSGWRSKKSRKGSSRSSRVSRDDGYVRAEVVGGGYQARGAYSGGRERTWWQRLLGTGS